MDSPSDRSHGSGAEEVYRHSDDKETANAAIYRRRNRKGMYQLYVVHFCAFLVYFLRSEIDSAHFLSFAREKGSELEKNTKIHNPIAI